MAKKPILTEEDPISLISLDPAAAARSIDTLVSQATDEYDFLSEKITIQFYNLEDPGKSAYFCFGNVKDPERFWIDHGEQKELTRGAVRFIESRQTPIYQYEKEGGDATHNKKKKIKKVLVGWKARFQCREIRIPKRRAAS